MQSPSIRAAGVLLTAEWVLLHRRARETVWSLPGGRVELGESAAQALTRELAEELSLSIVCGRLVFVAENFFSHAGVQEHEIGLYFLAWFAREALPAPGDPPFAGVEHGKRLEFCWFKRSHVGTVALKPAFLVSALAKPELEFEHVVERHL